MTTLTEETRPMGKLTMQGVATSAATLLILALVSVLWTKVDALEKGKAASDKDVAVIVERVETLRGEVQKANEKLDKQTETLNQVLRELKK